MSATLTTQELDPAIRTLYELKKMLYEAFGKGEAPEKDDYSRRDVGFHTPSIYGGTEWLKKLATVMHGTGLDPEQFPAAWKHAYPEHETQFYYESNEGLAVTEDPIPMHVMIWEIEFACAHLIHPVR